MQRLCLHLFCLVLVLVPGCAPAPSLQVASAAAVAPSPELKKLEEEVRQGINAVRRKHGLKALAANAAVADVAREHSRRMAAENFFAHEDPDGSGMVDRLKTAGIAYRVAAENLLTMTNMPDPVKSAVEGWMNSPGHRKNILRKDVSETGVGIWREGKTLYFTQVFIEPPRNQKNN